MRAALEAVQTSAGPPVFQTLKYVLKRRWKLVLASLLTAAVAAAAVLDVGGLRSRLLSLVPAPSFRSLAVLPVENLSGNPEAREDSLNKAKAAAATALRLNDSLAEVQAAMGFAKDYLEWQWEEAFGYFNRALEINPNMAEVYLHRGWLHVLFGRTEEALKDHMRVKQTDPFNGLNLGWLAELYRMQGGTTKPKRKL